MVWSRKFLLLLGVITAALSGDLLVEQITSTLTNRIAPAVGLPAPSKSSLPDAIDMMYRVGGLAGKYGLAGLIGAVVIVLILLIIVGVIVLLARGALIAGSGGAATIRSARARSC